jgi:SAM-dependent methyltransferase
MPKTVSEETERLKRHWEREAPTYDRRMGFFERVLFGDGREWVCSRASGEVLEVAVGTDRNFAFYPQGVRLSAIDLSPAMLEIARKRADELGLDADLREGNAQQLPFPDGIFGLYQTYDAWRLRAVVKRRMAFDPEVQLLLCRTRTAVVCAAPAPAPRPRRGKPHKQSERHKLGSSAEDHPLSCVRSRHPRYLPERSLGKETTSCENVVDGSCWIVRKQNDREAFSHALRTVARLSRPAWRP